MVKKASRRFHGEATGLGISEHPLIDLNILPPDDPEVDSTKQQEEDLPPSPCLCVSLSFTNVDLEVPRYLYKVLGVIDTYMCTKDKKAQFSVKSLRNLARSWLSEVSIKKNQVIDQENGDGNEEAKYSPEHVEQVKPPKAPSRRIRKMRPKIPKQVCALFAPRSEKYKSTPKRFRCISPHLSGKEKSEAKPHTLYDILEAIEQLHAI